MKLSKTLRFVFAAFSLFTLLIFCSAFWQKTDKPSSRSNNESVEQEEILSDSILLSQFNGTSADTIPASQLLVSAKKLVLQQKGGAAYPILKKTLAVFKEHDTKGQKLAETNQLIAAVFLASQQADSILQYTKAADIYIQKNGTPYERGFSQQLMGAYYLFMGQLDSSLHAYQQSEYHYKQMDAPKVSTLVTTYVNKGAAYIRLGWLRAGLKALEEGEKLAKTDIENEISLINIYSNIANVYASLGEYDISFKYYNYIIDILEKNEASPFQIASQLNNYGNTLALAERPKEGIEQLEKAKNLIPNNPEMNSPLLGNIMYSWGEALLVEKNYIESIQYFQKAATYWGNAWGEIHPAVAACKIKIGFAELQLNQLQKAKESYEAALAIDLKALPDPHHESFIDCYVHLAELAHKAGDKKQTSFYLENAFQRLSYDSSDSLFYRNETAPYFLMDALCLQSKIAYDQFSKNNDSTNIAIAVDAANKSVQVFDYLKSQISDAKSINYLFKPGQKIIEQAILVNLQAAEFSNKENGQQLFELIEQSKSVVLLETFRENDFFDGQFLKDSLFLKERDLRAQLTKKENNLHALRQEVNGDSERIRELTASLLKLSKKQEETLKEIERKYPDFFEAKFQQEVVSVQTIQKEVLSDQQAFTEYFLGDSSLFAFTILKDTFFVHSIKKDFPLEKLVEDMLQGIYDPFSGEKDLKLSTQKYASSAHELYQKLVAPIVTQIPKQTEWIIAPDGVLGYLPFDALISKAPENLLDFSTYNYLLNDYQISYTYSATLLQEMRLHKHKNQSPKNLLAFAPSFQNESVKTYTNNTATRSFLGPLAFNQESVLAIKNIIKANAFLDKTATKSQFLKLADQYRIIHLATHGKANDNIGEYSFLAFYFSSDSLQNNLLYNHELYQLRLNADMVVLSACETGIGELQRGEGIISLARGFSYAGAKSIITTLWSVNDKSSQILMKYFYEYIDAGYAKDQALRQAKLDYLQKNKIDGIAPYYWAGVVPFGDMTAIELKEENGYGWWITLGIFVLFGLFFLGRKWIPLPFSRH